MASMQTTTIRAAASNDVLQMAALLAELFAIESDFKVDTRRQQRGLGLLLDSDTAIVLVAETAGRITGMCTGQILISTAEGGPALVVEDVVVTARCQRQGIGTMLLEAINDLARQRGIARLQLLADRYNTTALDFYGKNRWEPTDLICLRQRVL